MDAPHDEVDRIVEDWRRERPDLDFSPLEVLSRVGRLAKPTDVAGIVAFLASDRALFITGQTIGASGGFAMV